MRPLLTTGTMGLLALLFAATASANADTRTEKTYEVFTDVNPCTGEKHKVTLDIVYKIRETGTRTVTRGKRTFTANSGYAGTGRSHYVRTDKVERFRFHDRIPNEEAGLEIVARGVFVHDLRTDKVRRDTSSLKCKKLPSEEFVDPPGGGCPVEIAPEGVRWSYEGGNETVKVLKDGRVRTTGWHTDRVTNVATEKSLLLRMRGSSIYTPNEDGSAEIELKGKFGFMFFPGDVGPGDAATGRVYWFDGRAQVRSDPSGAIVAFESSGESQDVCEMLAVR